MITGAAQMDGDLVFSPLTAPCPRPATPVGSSGWRAHRVPEQECDMVDDAELLELVEMEARAARQVRFPGDDTPSSGSINSPWEGDKGAW
jgi:elongation factor Tu